MGKLHKYKNRILVVASRSYVEKLAPVAQHYVFKQFTVLALK